MVPNAVVAAIPLVHWAIATSKTPTIYPSVSWIPLLNCCTSSMTSVIQRVLIFVHKRAKYYGVSPVPKVVMSRFHFVQLPSCSQLRLQDELARVYKVLLATRNSFTQVHHLFLCFTIHLYLFCDGFNLTFFFSFTHFEMYQHIHFQQVILTLRAQTVVVHQRDRQSPPVDQLCLVGVHVRWRRVLLCFMRWTQ